MGLVCFCRHEGKICLQWVTNIGVAHLHRAKGLLRRCSVVFCGEGYSVFVFVVVVIVLLDFCSDLNCI